MNDKIRLVYLDEEPGWHSLAYAALDSDFELEIPDSLPRNIEDLWTMVRDFNPQAVLVDYRLNEMGLVSYTGDEVIKEFRKHNLHLPMYIITSYEDNAQMECEEAEIIRSKEMLQNQENIAKLKNLIIHGVNLYNFKKSKAEEKIKLYQDKISTGEPLTDEENTEKFGAELYLSQLDLDTKIYEDLITERSNRKLDELLAVANKIVAMHKS